VRGIYRRGSAPLGEEGQTLIVVMAWLVLIMLVMGLVLDMGRLQVMRHELRSACEAGALAATLCAERQEEGHMKPVYEWVPDPATGGLKRVKVGEEWVVDREWAEILKPSRAREEACRAAQRNALELFPYAQVEEVEVSGLSGENPEVRVGLRARCATFLVGPLLGRGPDLEVRVSASSQAVVSEKKVKR